MLAFLPALLEDKDSIWIMKLLAICEEDLRGVFDFFFVDTTHDKDWIALTYGFDKPEKPVVLLIQGASVYRFETEDVSHKKLIHFLLHPPAAKVLPVQARVTLATLVRKAAVKFLLECLNRPSSPSLIRPVILFDVTSMR